MRSSSITGHYMEQQPESSFIDFIKEFSRLNQKSTSFFSVFVFCFFHFYLLPGFSSAAPEIPSQLGETQFPSAIASVCSSRLLGESEVTTDRWPSCTEVDGWMMSCSSHVFPGKHAKMSHWAWQANARLGVEFDDFSQESFGTPGSVVALAQCTLLARKVVVKERKASLAE